MIKFIKKLRLHQLKTYLSLFMVAIASGVFAWIAATPNNIQRDGAFSTGTSQTSAVSELWSQPTDTNGRRLLAIGADRVYRARGNSVQYSQDGGATWSSPVSVSGTNELAQYGGMEATGTDVHLMQPLDNPGPTAVAFQVRSSLDSGVTWRPAIRLVDSEGNDVLMRRVQIAALDNYVHIIGHDNPDNLWYIRSTDRGVSWEPGRIINTASNGQAVAVDRVTGTVHTAFTKDDGNGNRMAFYMRSTDNGTSWSSAVNIGGSLPLPEGTQPEQARVRVAAHDGNVVVAWEGSLLNGIRPLQGTRSSDGGLTWSDRETFQGQEDSNHHDLWMVGDVVHLGYNSGSAGDASSHLGYIYSLDAGQTWSQPEIAMDFNDQGTLPWNLRADADWVHFTTTLDWYTRRSAPSTAPEPEPDPSDTTSPTTSITNPNAGSSVSGSVQITADAADNVGVTSVQFAVNGSTLDTDTTSPYASSWDTTTASNGSATITVTAFDAAGNSSSDQITVTVDNTTPEPEPIPGDTNGDGKVDVIDLGYLLLNYGTSDPNADFDGDGDVDVNDLGTLLTNYGRTS